MINEIKQLEEVSQFYGKNTAYVIAGGGNTSFKTQDRLWVKPSGTSLATITTDKFVCLSREKLKVVATKTYSNDTNEREAQVKADLHASIIEPAGLRPSVETSLHEMIDYSFVVHTHPHLVNGLLCAYQSAEKVQELFGNEALYVPYTDPGYILFKAIEKAIQAYKAEYGKSPKVIFLENHGVFVAANTVDEINAIYTELESKISARVKAKALAEPSSAIADATLLETVSEVFAGLPPASRTNPLVQHFTASAANFEKVSVAYTPDHIVYCKSAYLVIENAAISASELQKEVDAFKAKNKFAPKVLAVIGKGIIGIEETVDKANIVLDVFEDMMKIGFYAENFGGPRFMTRAQIDFIDNWEVENYRRQMAAKL